MKCRLGDLARVSSSKRIYAKEYIANGIPFYRGKEIIELGSGRLLSNKLFISKDRFNQIKSKYNDVPEKDDVLITAVGTIGETYLVKSRDLPFYFKDGNLIKLSKWNRQIVLPEYMYYWLNSYAGKMAIKKITIGSTQQAITIRALSDVELDLPPISEQGKIAQGLSTLDFSIDNNKHINANLQELRHILYKQLIAQSALKTISIKELYSIKYGKTLPKSQLLRTGTKVFGAKCFMGYTERKPLVNKATVTITSRGSGAGFVSYIDEEEAFLTNNLLYLIDKTGLGLSFTYELIKSSKPSQFVTGSAQPQLTINNLKQLKLKIPTDRFIIEQFKNNTKRIEDCMSNNKIENNSLQKLRLAFLNYYF